MADITKCVGVLTTAQDGIVGKCEKRESCYRYTAQANEFRQSYFCEAPLKYVDKKQVCDYYYPIY